MNEVKILIVDDKKQNLLALTTLLEQKGRNIITSTSGEEALKLALEHNFALIMLDVQMPVMDGYEVASILKSSKRTSNIPIIFVTAISSEDTNVLKGFETGAVDFLFKPLNYEITRAKVDIFIRLHEQNRQLEEKNIELKKLNTMVENSVSAMCVLSGDDLIINSFNPAFRQMTQIEGTPETSTSFLTVINEEFAPDLKKKFLKHKKEGDVFSADIRYKTKDPKEGWANLSVIFKGEVWYVSMIDITAKKIAEEQMIRAYLDLEEKVLERTKELTEANKEMKDFVSAVSHDLRAPLRGISSLAAWIMDDFAEELSDDGKENLKLMMERVTRLDNMIQKVVDFSRLGKTLITHDDTDVKKIVEKVLSNLDIPDKVNIIVENDLPVIKFNQDLLIRIFRELINNSLRFVKKEGGEIKIGAVLRENDWLFFVKDNGEGMNERHLSDIFKVFYTNNPGPSDNTHVGMGLPQVKRIVTLKNGKVWAESKPGEGTTILFTIPHNSSLASVV